jgi:antitoxin HigA-1
MAMPSSLTMRTTTSLYYCLTPNETASVCSNIVTKAMTKMFNPPHPASILREDILPALQLSITEAAAQLGVNRVTFSRLLNEHHGISPDMALRLEAWLGVERGGSADHWLAMQTAYDLWQARKHTPKAVRRAPAEASV